MKPPQYEPNWTRSERRWYRVQVRRIIDRGRARNSMALMRGRTLDCAVEYVRKLDAEVLYMMLRGRKL